MYYYKNSIFTIVYLYFLNFFFSAAQLVLQCRHQETCQMTNWKGLEFMNYCWFIWFGYLPNCDWNPWQAGNNSLLQSLPTSPLNQFKDQYLKAYSLQNLHIMPTSTYKLIGFPYSMLLRKGHHTEDLFILFFQFN